MKDWLYAILYLIGICVLVTILLLVAAVVVMIFIGVVCGFFVSWLLGMPVEITKDGVTKRYRWFYEIKRG